MPWLTFCHMGCGKLLMGVFSCRRSFGPCKLTRSENSSLVVYLMQLPHFNGLLQSLHHYNHKLQTSLLNSHARHYLHVLCVQCLPGCWCTTALTAYRGQMPTSARFSCSSCTKSTLILHLKCGSSNRCAGNNIAATMTQSLDFYWLLPADIVMFSLAPTCALMQQQHVGLGFSTWPDYEWNERLISCSLNASAAVIHFFPLLPCLNPISLFLLQVSALFGAISVSCVLYAIGSIRGFLPFSQLVNTHRFNRSSLCLIGHQHGDSACTLSTDKDTVHVPPTHPS